VVSTTVVPSEVNRDYSRSNSGRTDYCRLITVGWDLNGLRLPSIIRELERTGK